MPRAPWDVLVAELVLHGLLMEWPSHLASQEEDMKRWQGPFCSSGTGDRKAVPTVNRENVVDWPNQPDILK